MVLLRAFPERSDTIPTCATSLSKLVLNDAALSLGAGASDGARFRLSLRLSGLLHMTSARAPGARIMT